MSGASKGSPEEYESAPEICNRYEYDAFGNTTVCEETVPNRFRFAGEQYDTVTGQYYLRARFYNSVLGRFLQEDTYYGDGRNLYAYCSNNPVSYVDSSGHEKVSAADKQALNDLVDEVNRTTGARFLLPFTRDIY